MAKFRTSSQKRKDSITFWTICIILILILMMFTKCGHRVWNWSANVVSDNPALFNDTDTIKGDTVYLKMFGGKIPLPMHRALQTSNVPEPILEHVVDSVFIEVPAIPVNTYNDSIKFERIGNAIWITIMVDNCPVKCLFDTGCEDGLFLTDVEYAYFKRNGIEVGQVSESATIGVNNITAMVHTGKLHNVKIGNRVFETVNVDYGDDQHADNLVGISMFDAKFAVDYKNNYIYFNHE